MTPSEAFLAWIDGKRLEIKRLSGGWQSVIRFRLEDNGLYVDSADGNMETRSAADSREYRLADSPAEPKPTVEDSEAWGLLRELVVALTGHEHLNQKQLFRFVETRDALKKRGML